MKELRLEIDETPTGVEAGLFIDGRKIIIVSGDGRSIIAEWLREEIKSRLFRWEFENHGETK